MHKFYTKFRALGQKGIVLPLVLTYILVFTAEITGLAEYASHTQRLVQSQQNYLTAFYLADAATEKSLAAIRLFIATNGAIPTAAELTTITQAPNVYTSGASFASSDTSSYSGAGWTSKTLTAGSYSGLNGNTQSINVSVTAQDAKNGVTHRATVSQTLEVQLIPIFQFGVFYQNDLEILPGSTMTFSGPVHTNGNLYLGNDGSTTSTNFDSTITAYGTLLHARKDGGSLNNGDVTINDNDGNSVSMKNGGSWVDSNAANWATESVTRWDDNVKTGSQGVKQLTLPIPATSNPHALVERKVAGESAQIQAQKMEYKAQIRIIDGVIQDQAGNAVELRYCSGGGTYTGTCPGGQPVVNPVTNTTFYNFREAKTIKSTDINVGLLSASPTFSNLVTANNGVVVYFSDRRDLGSSTYLDSVRLTNGALLPTKGLTVASENPMYVKGNYNTGNGNAALKQPSGLVSDAFNILSNNWNDANSTNTGLSGKTATATTVNTTVVTGNTETVGSQYNGGFENIHRFSENWTGISLTYSGSVIVLYNSQQATGNWIYGGNYYKAPVRNWGFDPALADPSYSIPGFPSVFNIAEAGYEAS
jgi:hypothetical protein